MAALDTSAPMTKVPLVVMVILERFKWMLDESILRVLIAFLFLVTH